MFCNKVQLKLRKHNLNYSVWLYEDKNVISILNLGMAVVFNTIEKELQLVL